LAKPLVFPIKQTERLRERVHVKDNRAASLAKDGVPAGDVAARRIAC
jgi:hypothetical protein